MRRPPAPGAKAAERELQALILARQARTLGIAKRAARRSTDAVGRDDVSLVFAALQEIIVSVLNLTPAEWRAIQDITIRIVEAGLRSAQARARVLQADPRTWGADERTLIMQAVEAQRSTVMKAYLDAGVWFAEDLQDQLGRAQALGTMSPREISALMTDRYGVAETYADRTALQVTRAGVEQAADVRMKAAGVETFTWRAVDRFARPLHRAINGNQYPVGVGHPTEGLPGQPWGCRCYADPDLPEWLTAGQQPLPAQSFRPEIEKNDPRGLPLLPEYTAPGLPRGASLNTLLSEMVTIGA